MNKSKVTGIKSILEISQKTKDVGGRQIFVCEGGFCGGGSCPGICGQTPAKENVVFKCSAGTSYG